MQTGNLKCSKDAMRLLYRMAKIKIESGVTGDLPFDEIQNAKEYFYLWKKKKPFYHNRLIFFFLTITLFFFFHPQNMEDAFFLDFILGVFWFLYISLELDKRKEVYIKNMLGDYTNVSQDESDFYIGGLLQDLWKIKVEKLRVFFIGASFFLLSTGTFYIGYFSEEDMKIVDILILITVVNFFIQNIVDIQKVK